MRLDQIVSLDKLEAEVAGGYINRRVHPEFPTLATIGSGAAGGTLTPSLAIGAALGGCLGGAWSMLWPGTPIAAFAFVAAAAFLASSMRAPLTALILLIEFTNQGPALLVPTMLAIAGSVTVGYILGRDRIAGIA